MQKLPEFETRAVYNKDPRGDALTFGILFKTARERLRFIELARQGAAATCVTCGGNDADVTGG